MSIEARINRIAVKLSILKQRLDVMGYQFQNAAAVLPGPMRDVTAVLQVIEREIGAVPEALKQFYMRIGSIDFTGVHPDWQGCEYPDALVVFPVNVAESELEDYREDPQLCFDSFKIFQLPIAPDYYHKEDVSGGACYCVELPNANEDPELLEEWHHTTFLDYLEIAVRWGGFPGLERYPEHNWPVAELTRDLKLDDK